MTSKQFVLCKDCEHVLPDEESHLKDYQLEYARCKVKRRYFTGDDAHDCQYCDFANPDGKCKEYEPTPDGKCKEYEPTPDAPTQKLYKPKSVLSKIIGHFK